MKTPRGSSESSTTSDNTAEFIDIVRKYDVVYNTHNQDYKNVEVKMKVWDQIADEIGLTVVASRRKWKNLRDSYTKYLRSFRVGTKTSKKYQYWAHADHMEFLKPYQGPGRKCGLAKTSQEEDNECDLGYQVLAKVTSGHDDLKIRITTTSGTSMATVATSIPNPVTTMAPNLNLNQNQIDLSAGGGGGVGAVGSNNIHSASPSMMLMPSLPIQVPLLPPTSSSTLLAAGNAILPTTMPLATGACSMLQANLGIAKGCLTLETPSSNGGDTFKKDPPPPPAPPAQVVSSTTVGVINNLGTTTGAASVRQIGKSRTNCVSTDHFMPVINKSAIRKTATATLATATVVPKIEGDVAIIMQAARELDANTLFFLSLARTVGIMPAKYQALAKMRCMRIVSDMELELDNVCDGTPGIVDSSTPPPPPSSSTSVNIPKMMDNIIASSTATDTATEHFVYVMSPSRVESMIDISSDDESTQQNGN